jgi:hypothetical protein
MSLTDERRRAKLDRYKAKTEMEMNERRARLQMNRIERGAFLMIAVFSALLAIALATGGLLHHSHSVWYPDGALSLIAVSGGCAAKLHFLRLSEKAK